ncbi:MAG: hypothetical protein F7B11_04690 [Caldisphaeraceae archaeon]|nr:hypothetical protein [Caldisphaeraceae archaeon]
MSYLEVRGEGLPVIVWEPRSDPDFVKGVVNLLASSYKKYFYERPSLELVMSWEMSIPEIFSVFDEYPVILEYQVLGGPERTDFIVVDHNKALIIESKVWRGKARRRNFFVQVDDNLRIDPCYQLNNYLAKFKNLHSALHTANTHRIPRAEITDRKPQKAHTIIEWSSLLLKVPQQRSVSEGF